MIILLSVMRAAERNMNTHIEAVAEKFNIPYILLDEEDYFNSCSFYANIVGGHPLAVGYSGIANGVQRAIQSYMSRNPEYFYSYTGTVQQ